MKRFYQHVAVAEAEPPGRGFGVRLDDRSVRTPARNVLNVPSGALARAVAREWEDQGDEIVVAAMPLTKLCTTAVDLLPARRGDAVKEALGYADTDMLCYRADRPPELAKRQERSWQPWLDWAAERYGARLVSTAAIDPVEQPPEALAALSEAVASLDSWRLLGLHQATRLTGSLVLGFAMEQGALDPRAAFEAAQADELFEIEGWGITEVQADDHRRLKLELDAVHRFLRLLPPEAT